MLREAQKIAGYLTPSQMNSYPRYIVTSDSEGLSNSHNESLTFNNGRYEEHERAVEVRPLRKREMLIRTIGKRTAATLDNMCLWPFGNSLADFRRETLHHRPLTTSSLANQSLTETQALAALPTIKQSNNQEDSRRHFRAGSLFQR